MLPVLAPLRRRLPETHDFGRDRGHLRGLARHGDRPGLRVSPCALRQNAVVTDPREPAANRDASRRARGGTAVRARWTHLELCSRDSGDRELRPGRPGRPLWSGGSRRSGDALAIARRTSWTSGTGGTGLAFPATAPALGLTVVLAVLPPLFFVLFFASLPWARPSVASKAMPAALIAPSASRRLAVSVRALGDGSNVVLSMNVSLLAVRGLAVARDPGITTPSLWQRDDGDAPIGDGRPEASRPLTSWSPLVSCGEGVIAGTETGDQSCKTRLVAIGVS